LERTRARTPEHLLVSIEEIGNLAVFLAATARRRLPEYRIYRRGYHILG